MEDKVMTEKYNVKQFGISFNGKIRYFVAQQHQFFYCKKCWLDIPKSKVATDQMSFFYSLN